MKSRALRVLATVLTMVPFFFVAQPAAAAPVDLTCPMTINLSLTPGAVLLPRVSTLGGAIAFGSSVSSLTPCSSPLSGTPYTGGSGPINGSGNLGCVSVGLASLVGAASGTIPITWNNGDTSQLDWTTTIGSAASVILGTISSGAMTGSTVALLPIVPTGLTGNCLLTPVTGLSTAGVAGFLQG
jgi:hypothetical protein